MRHAVAGLRREVLALSNAVFALRQSRKALIWPAFRPLFRSVALQSIKRSGDFQRLA
jgi:metallophosphoesterase superfamily enzyme